MSESTSPAGTTAESSAVGASPVTDTRHPTYRHDFGFLPIPKRLRYDPEKPFHFGILLNTSFGISSTLVCANLYYCQPILIQLSSSFSVTYDEVSRIPTLVQAGYGIGLLCISPLGDMVRCRGLILLLVLSSTCLTIGLAITESLHIFEVVSFLIGFTSVSPQILIPLAADLAPPHRRASAMSLVLSGFLLGILIARVLSGVVANFVSWRIVYFMSIGVQSVVLFGSYLLLPDYPAKNRDLSYLDMFRSMAKFMVTEPLVVQIMLVSVAASACYTNFWVTLTFLLGGPPYYYSTIIIGFFGLFGILGVVVVPFMGRIVDKLPPWYVALACTLLLIAFQTVETAAGGIHVAAIIITCFGLDVSRQTQQLALSTLLYGISESARSRLNSLLVLAIFLGQVMGTSVGTQVFVGYGWRADSLLSIGWFAWQLGILLLRGPRCPAQRWVGWQNGMTLKREAGPSISGESSRNDCEKGVELG
ncbi:MFS general substrate transporter [Gyrodon lividus]|nr:MFS general substrate transporter [Gyrodon lividus]